MELLDADSFFSDTSDLARYRKLKGLNFETDDDPKGDYLLLSCSSPVLALIRALLVSQLYFNQPLVFEPGTRYTYSPSTDFVGKLIETLTGLSLEEYL